MNCHPIIRPGFRPLSIVLMVLGFIVFWPLGLAMLAYMIWGRRLQGFARGFRDGFAAHGPYARRREGAYAYAGFGHADGASARDNAAFEAYRAAEIERLATERRRLDEERRAFEARAADQRRVDDRAEFDRFMADRRRRTDARRSSDAAPH
jgi:hypothetical protein